MTQQSLQKLGAMFESQSKDTWERLGYVKESFTDYGVSGSVRFGEETITNIFMMDLYLRGSALTFFEQTSNANESVSGTDFELWIGSKRRGWFRFAIQAKKLDLKSDRYAGLKHGYPDSPQINLLKRYSQKNEASAMYCLYNYTDAADKYWHWHCCDRTADLTELGCTVTPLSNVKAAIDTHGAKNFRYIHRRTNTLPLRCLVACPKVWNALEAMSQGRQPMPPVEVSPLFDPRSCYHRSLPQAIERPGAAVIRRSSSGGSLASIPIDPERERPDQRARMTPFARREFDERYNPDCGVPKVTGVIEIERYEMGESNANSGI